MSTLGIYSMDCTLRTWPSVSQFDDFMWSGLGDIDRLDCLDRIDNVTPLENQPPSSFSDSIYGSNGLGSSQDSESPTLFLTDSMSAADQWDQDNATDLASVLDDTFSRGSASSVPPVDDGFELYENDLLLNTKENMNGEVDFLMADPICEPTHITDAVISSDVNLTARPLLPDTATAGTACHQEPENSKWNTVGHIVSAEEVTLPSFSMEPQSGSKGVPKPTPPVLDCKLHYTSNGMYVGNVDPCSTSICTSGAPNSLSPAGREVDAKLQCLHQNSTLSRTESKAKRAQASRARRLAASQRRAEGRAKKYPLRKLIRMSSASTGFRDKLSHSSATLVPILHSPLHMVPQDLYNLPGRTQPFQLNPLNQQAAYVPVVIQGPPATSVQPSLAYPLLTPKTLPMELGYQQQPNLSQCENQSGMSESSLVQFPPSQQPLESSTKPPSLNTELDTAILKQLESVVMELDEQTRLCIRDSLNRLARNALERQMRIDANASHNLSGKILDPKLSCHNTIETETNPIDRWVVSLLFCKPPPASESFSHRQATAEEQSQLILQPHNSSEGWNACGSILNIQGQPRHMLTG